MDEALFLSLNCFTCFYYIKLRNSIYGTYADKNVSDHTGNRTRYLPCLVIDPLKTSALLTELLSISESEDDKSKIGFGCCVCHVFQIYVNILEISAGTPAKHFIDIFL